MGDLRRRGRRHRQEQLRPRREGRVHRHRRGRRRRAAGAGRTVIANDEGTGKDKKYKLEFSGLKPGTNQVRFENTGDELHHALFFPIREGVTIKEVLEAFRSEEEPEGPQPVDFAKGRGTAVIDSGIAQNITLDLDAGRYAVVCFISDRKGGEPHAAKGMLQELTVE